MARFDTSFNFGANVRPKKTKGKTKKAKGKKGAASSAWRAYVGGGGKKR